MLRASSPETAFWSRVIESFEAHRPMLLASFEAFTQSQHVPEIRERIAAAYEDAREGLGMLFMGAAGVDPATARASGAVGLAMLTGLMTQWLTDPERTPTGREVAEGLRALALAGTRTGG